MAGRAGTIECDRQVDVAKHGHCAGLTIRRYISNIGVHKSQHSVNNSRTRPLLLLKNIRPRLTTVIAICFPSCRQTCMVRDFHGSLVNLDLNVNIEHKLRLK
jgi:hypothetical protein